MQKVIKIQGMHCGHCSARVEKAFAADGIACHIDLAAGIATVSGDEAKLTDDALRDTVEALGFDVVEIR